MCTCKASRGMCLCARLWGSAGCSQPSPFFILPAWGKTCSTNFVRGIRTEWCFYRTFPQNSMWEPNKGGTARSLPTTKPVQREILNLPFPHPGTPTSQTLFTFPVCTTALFMSYPTRCTDGRPPIVPGCVPRGEGRRRQPTAK